MLDIFFFELQFDDLRTTSRQPQEKTWPSREGALTLKTTNSILRVIASVIAAGQNQISITELVSLSGIS
ncbi:hypothetical protein ACLBOM_35895 [Escherichia coli]